MKAIWIVAACMYLVTGIAVAQGAASAASAPSTLVSITSPPPSALAPRLQQSRQTKSCSKTSRRF